MLFLLGTGQTKDLNVFVSFLVLGGDVEIIPMREVEECFSLSCTPWYERG